ncbi:MAG: uroporphyrinogen decarboxylase [Corynebacteriales bacterium]|nr:uroporphyrinogen decarboxylase [Mycobacteriales bacterium]
MVHGAAPGHGSIQGVTSDFLAACRREPTSRTPVWFMRQAGRSLPEYRKVRAGTAMLDACATPELVIEVTLQPVRRHHVDAAIFFSDIVVPLRAVGVDVEIKPGVGPVIAKPIRQASDLDGLRALTAEDVPYITEAVTGLVRELGDVPLIGFAGAPFTLASYLVEGGPSKHHEKTKALMRSEPALWHALCDRLADISLEFLRVQVGAGASAVQLFDSWAGALSRADYLEFVAPHSTKILRGLGDSGVPRIHFGVGTGHMLKDFADAGADVVGVDWRTPLDVASRQLGPQIAVQGNLDPALLFASPEVVEREVTRILDEGRDAPGHIFNLGHGVLPDTDPDVITRVVDLVHERSAR